MKRKKSTNNEPKADGFVYPDTVIARSGVAELWGASCTRCHWRRATDYSSRTYAESGISSHLRMSHGLRLPKKPRIELLQSTVISGVSDEQLVEAEINASK